MSFLEAIGFWKSTPKPEVCSPIKEHFVTFRAGERVNYYGNDAVVLSTDGYNFWSDDANEIPSMLVSYKDNSNRVHREVLYPRDVYTLVSKVEDAKAA